MTRIEAEMQHGKTATIKKETSTLNSHCTSILRFWHKIEFFIPFDLQRQVLEERDAELNTRTFSRRQLDTADVRSLWQVVAPPGRKVSSFDVYLGVFDKAELTEIAQRVVHAALTSEEEYEQEERGELEGWTCFARIKVSAEGEPRLEEVSVSTAPWALGRIRQLGLAGLDFDAFQAGLGTLKDALKNFRAHRSADTTCAAAAEQANDEDAQPAPAQPLTAAELVVLLDIFQNWADFHPQARSPDAPVLAVRTRSIEEKAKKPIEKTKDAAPREGETGAAAADDDDEDEDPGGQDSDIDILNSFYVRDIARAITSLELGQASSALTAYLSPAPDSARVDLYQPAGRQRIAAGLRPSRINSGHWLDRPGHAMSLMQQFAINSVFEQLPTQGVFSVNGPPGTGKTTLLRDIFAENIVQRARMLAKYESSGEAFLPEKIAVNFKGAEKPCIIAPLREEITGFEMVVASTNNAAVENISRDLPKTKSLARPGRPGEMAWRDARGKATIGYLREVAHNVAARNSKGHYDKLGVDDVPWGLISCALGNKFNRRAFADRINFAGAKSTEKAPKGFDPDLHQSLWTWRDRYAGPSFSEARQAFLKADQDARTRIGQLDGHARLFAELRGHTAASFTAEATRAETLAHQALLNARAVFGHADGEWNLCRSQLDALQSEERLLERTRAGWWERLFKRPAYLAHLEAQEGNRRKQRDWLRRRYAIEEPRLAALQAMERAADAHNQAKQALATRVADWHSKQETRARLARDFPQANCPQQLDDLEQAQWQIDGLWQDELLNQQRAQLFAAALQLHEAWLAEVLKKGGRFGSNFIACRELLSGKPLLEPQHALAIWRSLFMIVPVVSCTFASFASQFDGLGANALGWLFIDEAGQAVPHAAVGALWRARRAVVVGDPLQVEPVFTVPIKLIEALAKSSDLPPDMDVAPHRVSVQTLADAANPLGTWIRSNEGRQWIGSPLRVHRRCADPMFSIANAIAYEGKMIFFDPVNPEKRRPPADSLDLGASAWVHAPGAANGRQSVPVQIDLVHRALQILYQRAGSMPAIYVISPFRRIMDELIARISNPQNWSASVGAEGIDEGMEPPRKSVLQDWCKARIGTVNTFQGKEESIVWMVLGCDASTRRAADWVAARPNRLNVALTRARHRFFMVGDAELWGGLPHFRMAHESLPRISPLDFVHRMGQPACLPVEAE